MAEISLQYNAENCNGDLYVGLFGGNFAPECLFPLYFTSNKTRLTDVAFDANPKYDWQRNGNVAPYNTISSEVNGMCRVTLGHREMPSLVQVGMQCGSMCENPPMNYTTLQPSCYKITSTTQKYAGKMPYNPSDCQSIATSSFATRESVNTDIAQTMIKTWTKSFFRSTRELISINDDHYFPDLIPGTTIIDASTEGVTLFTLAQIERAISTITPEHPGSYSPSNYILFLDPINFGTLLDSYRKQNVQFNMDYFGFEGIIASGANKQFRRGDFYNDMKVHTIQDNFTGLTCVRLSDSLYYSYVQHNNPSGPTVADKPVFLLYDTSVNEFVSFLHKSVDIGAKNIYNPSVYSLTMPNSGNSSALSCWLAEAQNIGGTGGAAEWEAIAMTGNICKRVPKNVFVVGKPGPNPTSTALYQWRVPLNTTGMIPSETAPVTVAFSKK